MTNKLLEVTCIAGCILKELQPADFAYICEVFEDELGGEGGEWPMIRSRNSKNGTLLRAFVKMSASWSVVFIHVKSTTALGASFT